MVEEKSMWKQLWWKNLRLQFCFFEFKWSADFNSLCALRYSFSGQNKLTVNFNSQDSLVFQRIELFGVLDELTPIFFEHFVQNESQISLMPLYLIC